jgi:seryl-tRNA(Sec) selenium transferase
MPVYEQFGLESIINAAGASTRVGGPRMHPAAVTAMADAAGACVPLDHLEAAASAITDRTVAVAYFANPESAPPVEEVAAVCRRRGVPLIVDAAAQLPPAANLRRFVDAGADLVAFSGGKALRGSQSTGIVAGRRDLIMSIALQHLDLDEHWSTWNPPQRRASATCNTLTRQSSAESRTTDSRSWTSPLTGRASMRSR